MKHPETPVIVVDSDSLRPMSWERYQFCFVDPIKLTSVKSKGFAVKTYKRCDALILIKADHQYRQEKGLTKTGFLLMLAKHGKC